MKMSMGPTRSNWRISYFSLTKNMKHSFGDNISGTDRKPNSLYQVVKTDKELGLFFTTI